MKKEKEEVSDKIILIPTEEDIQKWKVKYSRGVFELVIDTDKVKNIETIKDERGRATEITHYEKKSCFVRKPTREEIAASLALSHNPISQSEELLRTCFLGGDIEMINDDDDFQALSYQFAEVMAVRSGEVKKH